MPVTEQTYSFRASADLAPRMREAIRLWTETLALQGAGEPAGDVAREFYLSILRQRASLEEARDNQSALLRGLTEIFVSATEKVAAQAALAAYQDWAREDREAAAVRAGALRASADRWRDE